MKITFKFLLSITLLLIITQAAFAQSFCTQIANNDDLGTVFNNATLTFSPAALRNNDAELLEPASFTLPTSGTLSLNETTQMVTYTPAPGFVGPVTFTYTLKKEPETRLGTPLMINGEEHFYEIIQVNPQLSWQEAMMQASARSYNGLKGYLATVSSAEENEFIRQKLVSSSLGSKAWIGGSDAAAEGTWRWVTGPETGMPLTYSNWEPGEPNNAGDEDFMMLNLAGQWNDLANEGNAAAGFAVNLYVVEYGSAENCSDYLTATVTINVTAPPITPTGCTLALTTKVTQAEPWYGMWGYANGAGAIDLTVTGGTAPYTYKWNAGLSTEDITVATPDGYYTVLVTDASGCTATTTVFVGRKNDFLRVLSAHKNVSTPGGSDGAIDLNVIGGVVPATYQWSNGATTEDLTGLSAGTYKVIVTDAFGRQATTTVVISEPGTPLSLAISHQNVSAPGKQDGAVDLTVVGGVGPYTYLWNTFARTEDLHYATPGFYSVTVTDATGATATASVRVGVGRTPIMMDRKPVTGDDILATTKAGLTAYPNPARDQATVNFSLANAGKYTLDLYDIRGAKVKTLAAGQAEANKALAVEFNVADYAKGVYLLKLVTDKGVSSKRLMIQK